MDVVLTDVPGIHVIHTGIIQIYKIIFNNFFIFVDHEFA